MDIWSKNIKYIKGVGPQRSLQLAQLGITTVGQALEYYPRRYEDRTNLKCINSLTDGENEMFRGTIVSINESKIRNKMTILKIGVQDSSGTAYLIWFNQSYRKKNFTLGMQLVVFGKVKYFNKLVQIQNPDVEEINPHDDLLQTARILPVYPANEKISQRFMRGLLESCLALATDFPENLPVQIIAKYQLISKMEAIKNIHFPTDLDSLNKARYRLVFEELYILQCGLAYIKRRTKSNYLGIKHAPDGDLVKQLENNLPFTLTDDQQKVIHEIKTDMEDTAPMQRLVQGDVGSGKTVVAAIALAKTVENGYQGAMMVPTEILAEQHYCTMSQLFVSLGIHLTLLTGKLTKKVRLNVLADIKQGLTDIVIGTHALIQEDVHYRSLGLVVTDEQHRFGVQQRAALKSKGKLPDVLVMTATPIPRTMALTVYGELDVSAIRQMPPQRKAIKTYSVTNEYRHRVYKNLVSGEIEKGHQAYIVCPLVEESEKIDAQSAIELYHQLKQTYFKNIACAFLHGKMKPQEKDNIMDAFISGEIKVLISTTVIEVGVNVPNATVMVVENAERFGLSQLHQLRGRIGRGEHQSYCVLLSDNKSKETQERLMVMTTVHDGFVLAEKDLLLRGPGQFFGTRQHGMPDLKIANIITDVEILLKAREAAQETLNHPECFVKIKTLLTASFGNYFAGILND